MSNGISRQKPLQTPLHANTLRLAYQKLQQGSVQEAIIDLHFIKQDCDKQSAFHAEVTLILGDAERMVGDFEPAYLHIVDAINQCPELSKNISINTVFTCLTRMSNLPPDCPLVDEHIKAYLNHPMTICKMIEGVVKCYLIRRLGIGNGLKTIFDIDALGKDTVLHLAMSHLVLANRDLEITLLKVRKELLTLALEDALPESLVPLIIAFGFRAALNEYINPSSELEKSAIEQIANNLEKVNQKNVESYKYDLLLVAMYMPFTRLPNAGSLLKIPLSKWPKSLSLLTKQVLFDVAAEKKIAAQIPDMVSVTDSVSNTVSTKVRQQYEESPYPRWKKLGLRPNKKTYAEHYSYLSSHPLFKKRQSYDLLVAGCGTGEHPLQNAAGIKNLSITGLDLSSRSLAYAERKRKEFKIRNVKFIRGDILDLCHVNQRYDLIESVGVLHHMAEPELGLKNILSCLRPQGVLQLGLYSQIARKPFQALQERYQRYIGPDGEIDEGEMLALRTELLTSRNPDLLWADQALDFYSLSDFRDLLFHVQEHQFTVPMIMDLLIRFKLKFLGFHLPASVINHKLSLFTEDSSITNLETWASYEAMYPKTFIRMYNFHCCRE
jgi:SAM-dependent methyltransferase